MRRVKPGLIVALLLGSIFLQPATSQAQAQRPRRVFGLPFDRELPDSEKALRGRNLFVTDRQMTLRLTKSKEYLRENRFAEGLRLLQSILDHSEDLLFNDENRKQAHWHT